MKQNVYVPSGKSISKLYKENPHREDVVEVNRTDLRVRSRLGPVLVSISCLPHVVKVNYVDGKEAYYMVFCESSGHAIKEALDMPSMFAVSSVEVLSIPTIVSSSLQNQYEEGGTHAGMH
jgi:hypothetical protein